MLKVIVSGSTSKSLIQAGQTVKVKVTGQGLRGRKGMQWKSAYVAETTYVVDDVVRYNGSSYICIAESTGNAPTDEDFWDLVAQKGEAGGGGGEGGAFTWLGAYVNETAYVVNDVVSENGSSYICIADSAGNPPTNAAFWDLMAQVGNDGNDGADGADGKTILSGAGAPGGGTGVDGDFYIDTTGWDIYGPKAAGAWGAGTSIIGPAGNDGNDGSDGADGKTILSGAGAPGGGTGVDGDFYIDTTGWDIYGPKAGGAWGAGTSIIGPAGNDGNDGADGADGKTILSGAGAPGGGTGIDGDFYIDTTGWDIYGPKAGGAWGAGTSIIGPAGNDGNDGADGADGENAGVPYTFSTTTTDADPGNGTMRFNNATIASVTNLYIDNQDFNANSMTAFLDAMDDSTNTIKGFIIVKGAAAASTQIAIFKVTGAIVDGTGYRKVPVTYLSGSLPANNDKVTISFTANGDAASLQYFTESYSNASPNNTVTVVRLVPNTGDTNTSAVYGQKGTGSIQAQQADGTATGGDPRGTRCVDWQLNRVLANEVCLGISSGLLSGYRNKITANGNYSGIGSGYFNYNDAEYTFTGGGSNHRNGGLCGFIGAGDTNNISAIFGQIPGGRNNTINSYLVEDSAAIGSFITVQDMKRQVATGYHAKGYLRSTRTHGFGIFSANGDNQSQEIQPYISTAGLTTGGTTIVRLDGSGATDLITPQGSNRVWNCTVKIIAVVTAKAGTTTGVSVNDTFTRKDEFTLLKAGGASSILGTVGKDALNRYSASMAACDMNYTIGGSNDLIATFTAPTFAGGGSLTIRVNAYIHITEMAW